MYIDISYMEVETQTPAYLLGIEIDLDLFNPAQLDTSKDTLYVSLWSMEKLASRTVSRLW